uniref:Uncharacterized protein n=1 Tax=Cryptosporidium parvum TaxID=5807 RepID=F0X3V1_CRYPV
MMRRLMKEKKWMRSFGWGSGYMTNCPFLHKLGILKRYRLVFHLHTLFVGGE